MIGFRKDLFVSEELKDQVTELRNKLVSGERVKGIYVCCLNAATGKEEALKSELLAQSYYRDKDIEVTALIGDREEMLLYLAAETVSALGEPDTNPAESAEGTESTGDPQGTPAIRE